VQVSAVPSSGSCLLRIDGELDVLTADALAVRAAVAILGIPGPVLVDLSGLTFIDAHGARALDALILSPPDGRPTFVRRCPFGIRRVLNVLRLPLDYPAAVTAPGPAAAMALTNRVRDARLHASESRMDASATLALLADTLIRLASTRERTDLIREQARQTVARARAVRERLATSRPAVRR
jgi:hypothetical protein